MPRCSICLQQRPALKFRTGRLSICRFCVRTLNSTPLSAREARQKWEFGLRQRVLDRDPAASWVDRWLEGSGDWILSQWLDDAGHVRRSPELKILRAHRIGLVCLHRRYLDYPANWDFKRYRVKHFDGNACYVCGQGERDGAPLHVHHIVFRSNSGTNGDRNLVTLCRRHHQDQHDHSIGEYGGEPIGSDVDMSTEGPASVQVDTSQSALLLPAAFDENTYRAVLPSFETGLEYFLANGKSAQDFFVFCIQLFGRNVGRYALRFAEDERRRRSSGPRC